MIVKKLYVEGGKSHGSVPGVKVSRKGPLGGTKAAPAKKVCRVNGLTNQYVERPHPVGGGSGKY